MPDHKEMRSWVWSQSKDESQMSKSAAWPLPAQYHAAAAAAAQRKMISEITGLPACSVCLLDEILDNSVSGLGVKVPSVQYLCYGFISLGKLESGGSTDSSSVHNVSIFMVAGAWCTQSGECEMGCLEGFLQMGNWLLCTVLICRHAGIWCYTQ